MAYHTPQHVAELSIAAGERKATLPLGAMLVLGFLAGAFVALGFLVDVRVSANLPPQWGSFGSFLGAAVFPVGLILVIIAGGELVTGNMMALPMALMSRKITGRQLVRNWFWVTISNFVGAIFVAYFFGHIVGLTESGPFVAKTVSIAKSKLDDSMLQTFISAIGCNWLVALAVWLSYSAEDVAGKILAIWWPIMTFVAIGFQHVVANMFIIPAAIFAGHFTWADYLRNFVAVWLGNVVGASIFVAGLYWYSYIRETSDDKGKTPRPSILLRRAK
jgi:formate/nitrite transporter